MLKNRRVHIPVWPSRTGAQYLQQAVNPSRHKPWQEYYTDVLAACVYRAYERDFDEFGYSRAIK